MSLEAIRQSAAAAAPPTDATPGTGALSELEQRIYAAVAYRDVFQFPPTAEEIHRYLPGAACALDDVLAALNADALVGEYLITDGRHFALRGRDDYFPIRDNRATYQRPLNVRAARFGRWLATIPFVEMVAISGSLAADNADAKADVDLFVVMRAGHLWRTRLLILLLRRLEWRIGSKTFCPNSMRTTGSLSFEYQRLYIAQELTQLVPIYGYPVYQALMDANRWTQGFLPNADPKPAPDALCRPYTNWLKPLLERLLGSSAGRSLEHWWSRRKIGQFEKPSHELSSYSEFDMEREGLNLAVADAVESALQSRLQAARIAYDDLLPPTDGAQSPT